MTQSLLTCAAVVMAATAVLGSSAVQSSPSQPPFTLSPSTVATAASQAERTTA